jgi:hypothetical protein
MILPLRKPVMAILCLTAQPEIATVPTQAAYRFAPLCKAYKPSQYQNLQNFLFLFKGSMQINLKGTIFVLSENVKWVAGHNATSKIFVKEVIKSSYTLFTIHIF